ncbi:2-nitropropane dioxygenase [Multifurca ochricompacta]|uniref:2-nitropropane dioxygenase n=1 Tax=Multifurca ochricompacta TaxID=376703 RepID=A0AAD4QRD4_9AGAM|nr:2-nitropropane dioxygenase [Multifurca ochricompacta]
MSTIKTAITRLLGIKTPIVLAPMGGASGGALASEVSLAGGFGFLSPAYTGVDKFRDEFHIARSILNRPSGPLPIGAGFLGWKLEEERSPHVALLELALENGVQAIWLSFGEDLGRWIDLVRNHDQKSGKTPSTLIFVQVNTVEEALIAFKNWKVDVLVAQGIESGGHGSASAPPVFNLVPQILSALSALPSSGAPPPVLAAGGLSSGAHLSAFLTLGAAGAVVGTRFLVAEECQYSDVQKRAIIAAKSSSAVRSYVFDKLRDTTGWPAGVNGRALAMPAVEAVESGADIAKVKEEVAEGAKRGDPSSSITWAGTGVGPLYRLQPAKDIVRELHDAAVAYLKASSALLGDA